MIQNMPKTMKNAKFENIMKIMKNMPSGISKLKLSVTKETSNHKHRMVVDYSETINCFTEPDAYPGTRTITIQVLFNI